MQITKRSSLTGRENTMAIDQAQVDAFNRGEEVSPTAREFLKYGVTPQELADAARFHKQVRATSNFGHD